jgi:hypothetical protein
MPSCHADLGCQHELQHREASWLGHTGCALQPSTVSMKVSGNRPYVLLPPYRRCKAVRNHEQLLSEASLCRRVLSKYAVSSYQPRNHDKLLIVFD